MDAKNLSVKVSVNTDAFVAKLKAISKHTKALADELEAIDESFCPRHFCGPEEVNSPQSKLKGRSI